MQVVLRKCFKGCFLNCCSQSIMYHFPGFSQLFKNSYSAIRLKIPEEKQAFFLVWIPESAGKVWVGHIREKRAHPCSTIKVPFSKALDVWLLQWSQSVTKSRSVWLESGTGWKRATCALFVPRKCKKKICNAFLFSFMHVCFFLVQCIEIATAQALQYKLCMSLCFIMIESHRSSNKWGKPTLSLHRCYIIKRNNSNSSNSSLAS